MTNNIEGNTPEKEKAKHQTKAEIFAITLIDRLTQGITTFEANSIYQDTCLHTTVSDFRRNHGIILERKQDPYTNSQGRTTKLTRYWLNQKDVAKVKRIVNTLRLQRGAPILYELELVVA